MPFDRRKYPDNWEEISKRVKEEAGWRCEGSPAYPDCRAEHGKPHPVTGSRVILTVAHMNHDESDCSRPNLRALCQRCHLTHDGKQHAQNAKKTRRAKLEKDQLRLEGV